MATEQFYTKIVQIKFYCVEQHTLPNSHLLYTTVTSVAQTKTTTTKNKKMYYKAKFLKC